MKYQIVRKQIGVGEWTDALESLPLMLKLMSRFMVDDEGQPVPQPEAYALIRALDLDSVEAEQMAFLSSMQSATAKK